MKQELSKKAKLSTEVESLRTSLASRTHFEVLDLEAQVLGLGLGLEACKSSKMLCPRLEGSIIFCLVKKKNNQTKDNITAVCQFVASFPYLKNDTM